MLQIKQYIYIIFLLFFSTTNGFGGNFSIDFKRGKVAFLDQNMVFFVEVVSTKKQRNIGLMFRKHLAHDNGMIFIFEQEERQRVWMKDTLIPLDVVFISAKEKVVSIFKNLQPCINHPCPIFISPQKAKYMLEIVAGTVQNKGFKIGQQLSLDL
ncbi:MAG: DUF192 domain-containing protein [Methylococcaceae bacterium]|nr:DUF192 domain-containing protein [Methylococcaceae bacterium]